ncbi:MAG: hypothetical protein AseanaTS_06900 [Candidatus Pelagadaptatus aseana]|uniref:hypothetical protein n=1 Tax=Candidatus Pelagadaptatus aseana TaxID=3120508 RepID=UPI0039B2B543
MQHTDNKAHSTVSDNRPPNCLGNVTEYSWADAFYRKDIDAFLNIFDPRVTQSASTSPYINYGSQEVAGTFQWASHFYQRCDFTHQASAHLIEFLEWDLTTANNMHMTGMTVLTKDPKGKVIKVFNGHRNLTETVIFPEHFVKGPTGKGTVALFHKKALKKYGLDHQFPRNTLDFKATSDVSEAAYIDAFRSGLSSEFINLLADDVELSGSYVANTLKGKNRVSHCMGLVANFYEHCTFTTQATEGNRTYLLYRGRLRNGMVISDGFLILVRNASGQITEIMDNPIPMHAGTLISAYLAAHHDDKAFAEQFFYHEKLFAKAVSRYSLDGVYGDKTRDLSSIKGFLAHFFIQV